MYYAINTVPDNYTVIRPDGHSVGITGSGLFSMKSVIIMLTLFVFRYATRFIPNAFFVLFIGSWNVRIFRHIQLGAKASRLFGNIFAEIESENNAQRRFQKCWRMRNILEARQIYGKSQLPNEFWKIWDLDRLVKLF